MSTKVAGNLIKIDATGVFASDAGIAATDVALLATAQGFTAQKTFTAAAGTVKRITTGAASETVDLDQWKTSAGVIIASVGKTGTVSSFDPTGALAAQILHDGTSAILQSSGTQVAINTNAAAGSKIVLTARDGSLTVNDGGAGTTIKDGGSNRLRVKGLQVQAGSGVGYCWSSNADPTAALPDTGIYRDAAAVIRVGDGTTGFADLRMAKICTNTTAVATVAVGVLSNKLPVYDNTGGLIGYVPIYASIT